MDLILQYLRENLKLYTYVSHIIRFYNFVHICSVSNSGDHHISLAGPLTYKVILSDAESWEPLHTWVALVR